MEFGAALRPNIIHGFYPQKEEVEEGLFDNLYSQLAGFVRQRVRHNVSRKHPFVQAVNRLGDELKACDDATLQDRVQSLKQQLCRSDFQDALVAEAFAVIRELAARILQMRHFDVQLLGGWVMLRGMIAEMQTGEGKTLTATLAAGTAALAGIPVHVVTVNDYLVSRDAEKLRPLYESLGLSVGAVTESMSPDERRAAYGCDVVYCCNKQLVFDYLRDRITIGRDTGRLRREMVRLQGMEGENKILMRGLCFAIIDEADSVLIDEARTPLIISQTGDGVAARKMYTEALELARQLTLGEHYSVDVRNHEIRLKDAGKTCLEQYSQSLGGIWTGQRRREELINQALTALHLFIRDKHYMVKEGKVQIIDEYTGRVMPDRTWERGLHQLIEVKEDCDISTPPETIIKISYQRFFRRYLRFAGMTGTAREVTAELWSVYRTGVTVVEPHKPSRRRTLPTRVFKTAEAKWSAVIDRTRQLHATGQPVLIGTRSVGASEQLSERMSAAGIAHEVLNARQDHMEAEIIAQAGQRGRVTVATNMAGRGTDIALGEDVAGLGGLYVIATERHDASRIDRQLSGRCSRQGDPGVTEAILSLQDELVDDFFYSELLRQVGRLGGPGKPLPHWLGLAMVTLPQRMAELRYARVRRDLLKYDEKLGKMLAFSGGTE